MKRSDFIYQSGLLASLGLLTNRPLNLYVENTPSDPLKSFLLNPMPSLEHHGGLNIRTWVRSEMTGGVFSSVETAVAPKTIGPPPHYHKELDELMYVIEGTASVIVGNEIVEVKAGGWHFRPRMIQHTFWNAGNEGLRFVDMYFNQPFEQYLERIFNDLTEKNGFSEGSEAKRKELDALNNKFGVVFTESAFAEYDEIKKRFKLK